MYGKAPCMASDLRDWRWDDTHAFFVGLFAKGQLTGGCFVALRDA
jgi:hypothetical protein